MNNTSDYEYFQNKRTDRVYLSKSLETKLTIRQENGKIEEITRPLRIISKIIETPESHKFIKDGKQVSLRITSSQRQEIKAKFYEDSRGVITLQIQKYTVKSGAPHNTYFTFQGKEIQTLLNFIRNIPILPINTIDSIKYDDKFLDEITLSKEQAMRLINEHPDLIDEILRSNLTKEDIINLAHRKSQVEVFEKLLSDELFFSNMKEKLGANKGDEHVWQNFFESNKWIFGYGLDYIFNSAIEGKKLEQVTSGYNFNSSGKRIDALMKTKGIISSFCFGEIKTHKTELLKIVKSPYRGESWAISDELAGAIAQTQKSVQKSIKDLGTKTQIKDEQGYLTGEEIFLYQPKSFVIIGNLNEFKSDQGINEDKFSSFELFRKNQINPEIITFDELFERAKYIIKLNEAQSNSDQNSLAHSDL